LAFAAPDLHTGSPNRSKACNKALTQHDGLVLRPLRTMHDIFGAKRCKRESISPRCDFLDGAEIFDLQSCMRHESIAHASARVIATYIRVAVLVGSTSRPERPVHPHRALHSRTD
jgi:hypothetical protein